MSSCFEKIQGGFAMGGALGLAVGSFFSPIASWRAGLRGRQLMRNTAQQMLTFGVLFGMFLAVGTGIRCEAAALQQQPALCDAPATQQRQQHDNRTQ